ncbi:M23 family metallopeptidase [Olivibacter sp. XZL3]|uniref:M23 family metallopeptidase n=1 Tax=Olivibacter sp. XZL3 TaxID=1735116 RepID=UPI001065507E|nr:M23 family metallopeptidase [Olivibacter sp. XZL3]
MTKVKKSIFWLCCLPGFLLIFDACKSPVTLFKGQYAHQRYVQQLKNAGLENTLLYRSWISEAENSLKNPQEVSVPYQEHGYFQADRPTAMAFVFEAKEGERLEVSVTPIGLDSSQLFIDLFQQAVDSLQDAEHVTSADTNAYSLLYEVEETANYVLRIQPELLTTVSYELKLTAEGSLSFPVAASPNMHIGSFYGADRDAGARKHEGVDIFAQRLTPAIAAATGRITRVGTNNLGGNVIWLRPHGKPYNLYYAHLDTQLVQSGSEVKIGDTLGLVGNTGNARTTPPHLHFGIYSSSGVVDPLPFLRPNKSTPPRIASRKDRIGDTLRLRQPKNYVSIGKFADRPSGDEPVIIEAAMQNNYRVLFPDKRKGLIPQNELSSLSNAVRTVKLKSDQPVYKQPDVLAARLGVVSKGTLARVLATYRKFYLIEAKTPGWILQEM